MIKIPTEYEECKAFFEWAQLLPIVSKYLIKHVNEGKRSKITGLYLQRIGMRKGLPDYQLPISNGKWFGLWIEMKRRTNNKSHSKEQCEWIDNLIKVNQFATFAYGWEDAVRITTDYLNKKI